jgi:hypothetical protein
MEKEISEDINIDPTFFRTLGRATRATEGPNGLKTYTVSVGVDEKDVVIYIGDHDDFTLYMMSNFSPNNSYISTKNRRRGKWYMMKYVHPIYSREEFGEIRLACKRARFQPENAVPVRIGKQDKSLFIEDKNSRPPEIDPTILHVNLQQSRDFANQCGGIRFNWFPLVFGEVRGVPLNRIRGIHGDDKMATISKLQDNELAAHASPKQMVFALDKMWARAGMTREQRIPFTVPSYTDIYYSNYGSQKAGGYCELGDPTDHVRKEVSRISGRLVQVVGGMQPKKGAIAGTIARHITNYYKSCVKLFERNEIPASGYSGFHRCIVEFKKEIGLFSDFYDLHQKFDEDQFIRAIKKHKTKIRAFWKDSAIRVVLDRAVSYSASKKIVGGTSSHNISIGVDTLRGTFVNLLLQLRADGEYVSRRHKRELKKLYKKYPELKDRFYEWLDWSKYDSKLNHNDLLFAFCANIAVFDPEKSDFTSEQIEYFIAESATSLAYKFATIPLLKRAFFIAGVMKSGAFWTSVGDSVIQVMNHIMFTDSVIEKLIREGKRRLAKLAFISVHMDLVRNLIYGDDNTGGVPKVLKEHLGLAAFAEWCETNAGFLVKELHPSNGEEPYADAIGQVSYEQRGDYYIENYEYRRDSPTYLKNRAVEVYEDGEFQGIFPHRTTEDLLAKMGNSMRAVGNPTKYLCALISLGYLAIGNTEAYYIIKSVYDNYRDRIMSIRSNVDKTLSDYFNRVREDTSLLTGMSNSMRRVLLSGLPPVFPLLSLIRARHDETRQLNRKAMITYDSHLAGYKEHYMAEPTPILEEVEANFDIIYQQVYRR